MVVDANNIKGKLYDVWLNGGKVKYATYADNINGVVKYVRITPNTGKLKIKLRKGKVTIHEKIN